MEIGSSYLLMIKVYCFNWQLTFSVTKRYVTGIELILTKVLC